MLRLQEVIAGDNCTINVWTRPTDNDEIMWFVNKTDDHGKPRILALDTESTGLNTNHPDWQLRMIQFGTSRIVYVLPASAARHLIEDVLSIPRCWVGHNFPHDVRSLDAYLGYESGLLRDYRDTFIYSHLLDSRNREEGGSGHRLEDLAVLHVDRAVTRFEQDLKAAFKEIEIPTEGFYKSGPRKGLPKTRKARYDEGWSRISLWDERYLRYAGADPLLTMRVYRILRAKVRAQRPMSDYLRSLGYRHLEAFERAVQRACDRLQRVGVRIDVPYVERTIKTMIHEAELDELWAEWYGGVTNVNSTAQLADALLFLGAPLHARTPTGKLKVDNTIMKEMRNSPGDLGKFAAHVLRAKQARKRVTAYLETMLAERDANDRAHATIKSLAARTARMSISGIPFHQLPSNEKRIRQAIIADPGWAYFSVDFDQQEMRMAGALSGEEKIIEAAKTGFSIHKLTAETVFGPEYTPEEYKFSKNLNFGWLFGGGANTLARQTGIPLDTAAQLIKRYSAAYPTMNQWKREMTESVIKRALTDREYTLYCHYRDRMWNADGAVLKQALRREIDQLLHRKMGYVVTPVGRRLLVEASKAYRVVNYLVQSSSRDVTAAGFLRVMKSEYAEYARLVIHDEVLGEAPEDIAEDVAQAFAALLTTEFQGVPITAGGKVYGPSWGDGYGN